MAAHQQKRDVFDRTGAGVDRSYANGEGRQAHFAEGPHQSTPSAANKGNAVKDIASFLKDFDSCSEFHDRGMDATMAEGNCETKRDQHALESVRYNDHNTVSLNKFSDIESVTIHKQRRELQLLITELKDRDRELNDMVSSHQKQRMSWESDRQQVLLVKRQNSKLRVELKKRSESLLKLKESFQALQDNQQNEHKSLTSTKEQLTRAKADCDRLSRSIRDTEGKNDFLTESMMQLSASVATLKVQKQELLMQLKLKESDISAANLRLTELTKKTESFQKHKQEQRKREMQLHSEMDQWKEKHASSQKLHNKLKDEMTKTFMGTDDNSSKLSQAKQEALMLQKEIFLAAEREKRKDQLLELCRSKQERVETELHHLRQLYERQQRDAMFSHQDSSDADAFSLSERLSEFHDDGLSNRDGIPRKEGLQRLSDDSALFRGQLSDPLTDYRHGESGSPLQSHQHKDTAGLESDDTGRLQLLFNQESDVAQATYFAEDEDRDTESLSPLHSNRHKGELKSSPAYRLQLLLAESEHMVDTLENYNHSEEST